MAYTPSATAQQTDMKADFSLLFWTIGIVGGCIAITLTYVSWRKYKGEEKKRKQQDNIID
nr:sporulation protein YpjB [Oceanobacillus manasiensis]